MSEKDFLNIGEECEEWPVQKVENIQTKLTLLTILFLITYFTVYSAKEGSEEGESGYFMQVLKEIEGVKLSHIFFGQAVNTDTII